MPNCSMGLFWDFSPFLQAFTRLCGKTGSKFLSQNSPMVLFRLSLMQLLFQGFKKCIPEYSQHGGHVHRAMATAFSFPGLQSFWVFWFARRIERMWQGAQGVTCASSTLTFISAVCLYQVTSTDCFVIKSFSKSFITGFRAT